MKHGLNNNNKMMMKFTGIKDEANSKYVKHKEGMYQIYKYEHGDTCT